MKIFNLKWNNLIVIFMIFAGNLFFCNESPLKKEDSNKDEIQFSTYCFLTNTITSDVSSGTFQFDKIEKEDTIYKLETTRMTGGGIYNIPRYIQYISQDNGNSWVFYSTLNEPSRVSLSCYVNDPLESEIRDSCIANSQLRATITKSIVNDQTMYSVWKKNANTPFQRIRKTLSTVTMVRIVSDQLIFYTTNENRMEYTQDGGKTWSGVDLPESIAIFDFSNSTDGVFVGSSRKIYSTTDRGLTWKVFNQSREFTKLYTKENEPYFLFGKETFLQSLDKGESWKSIDTSFANYTYTIRPYSVFFCQ